MRFNSQLSSFNQSFASPLREIDRNISAQMFASPINLKNQIAEQGSKLKRKLTHEINPLKAQHPLLKKITISYKENVSAQMYFSKPRDSNAKPHQHDSVKPFQFQPMTCSFKGSVSNKQTRRQISIKPFQIQSSSKIPTHIQAKDFCENDFEKIRQLGKGKFGTVWLVRDKKTNFICALKIIKKDVVREEKVQHQVAKEIRIHNSLKHANIIDFYGYFHDENHVYILTEYATGGHVYSLLRKKFRLQQKEISSLVNQTANGLSFMHNMGFIHRDIKPQNLILQFDTVKICDLGWAAECSHKDLRKSICGTPLYYSPELVRQEEHNGLIDVWSLGILAYELAVGRIPFKIFSEFDLPVILQQEVVFPEYVDMGDTIKNFILACLNKNTILRPNICKIKEHPFLQVESSDRDWVQLRFDARNI